MGVTFGDAKEGNVLTGASPRSAKQGELGSHLCIVISPDILHSTVSSLWGPHHHHHHHPCPALSHHHNFIQKASYILPVLTAELIVSCFFGGSTPSYSWGYSWFYTQELFLFSLGDHMGCWRLNPSRLHTRQTPSPLRFLSSPPDAKLREYISTTLLL